jgi:hypothetical protein
MKVFIFLSGMFLFNVNSQAATLPCLAGEEALLRCENSNAGWGLDAITVNVCRHTNDQIFLVINRKIISKNSSVELRISAQMENENLEETTVAAYDYVNVYKLTYSPKTKSATYLAENGNTQMQANLSCK